MSADEPKFTIHDLVECDWCECVMLPDISTAEQDDLEEDEQPTYGWICVNFKCPEGQLFTASKEDWEAVGASKLAASMFAGALEVLLSAVRAQHGIVLEEQ